MKNGMNADIVMEDLAVGDHARNGAVEKAVQQVRG
jgi:hypothetical protein